MRKVLLLIVCLVMLESGVAVVASDSKDFDTRRNDLPHEFLQRSEGSITMRKEGESISLWANKSTLEEMLQKVVEEKGIILKFYCDDPSLKKQRMIDVKLSADSIVTLLRQLLSEDHRFVLLNGKGMPSESGKDISTVNIYPVRCTGIDDPVRLFIAERDHPLLRKPLEAISVDEIADILKKEGPASRRRAVETLGRMGDEKGIPCAKKAIGDENIRVMFAAANTLMKLGKQYGSEKVLDAIYQRFLERPYGELLLVMAQLGSDKMWPIVDALMDQPGERERSTITRALFVTNDRRAIKYLSKIASGGNVEIARQAMYAIGKLGGPEAATVLMSLLRGGDAQRQARAAQAVYFLSGDERLELQVEVGKIAKQETVSDIFLRALVEVSYLEPIKDLLADPASSPEVKIRALRAMATARREGSLEVLTLGLNDKAPEVRLASVEALGASVTEAAIPYLVGASKHEDAKVRAGAVKALAEFPGDERVVEALGKTIDDTDEDVRRKAVDALGALGRPSDGMIAIVRRCESHKDPYVARKAGSILAHWGMK